jgi:hypothetical protein
MKKVDSSHIDYIHYEPLTKTCSVRFKNGEHYHYRNMTQEAYDAFDKAKSHGKHLKEHIVGKYAHWKAK